MVTCSALFAVNSRAVAQCGVPSHKWWWMVPIRQLLALSWSYLWLVSLLAKTISWIQRMFVISSFAKGCQLPCLSKSTAGCITKCFSTNPLEKTLMLEKIEVGGKGDNRGWNGWMTSPIWGTWVWVGFRSWWWTGKPGVLQPMGLQRLGHNWVTELDRWRKSGKSREKA